MTSVAAFRGPVTRRASRSKTVSPTVIRRPSTATRRSRSPRCVRIPSWSVQPSTASASAFPSKISRTIAARCEAERSARCSRLTTDAGTPPSSAPRGAFDATTEFAITVTSASSSTPGRISAPGPSHERSPIETGAYENG